MRDYYAVKMVTGIEMVFDWDHEGIAEAIKHRRVIGLIRNIEAEGTIDAEREAKKLFAAGQFERTWQSSDTGSAQPANPTPLGDPIPSTHPNMIKTTHAETAASSAPNTDQSYYDSGIRCDNIVPDPSNRDVIDHDRIAALAKSIESEGLLQPILLLKQDDGKFRIIAGEHRWRAHVKLKRETIEAKVYDDQTAVAAARKKAVENFQRTALTPIEEARKYRELADLGMKQQEIADLLGKSRPVIANALRVLELPSTVQTIVRESGLSMAHAVSLCRFKDTPKVCEAIAELAATEDVPAKDLDKGLPFAEQLAEKELVVDLGYRDEDDLSPEDQKNPDLAIGGSGYNTKLYCLDIEKGKKKKADHEAEQAAERAKWESPSRQKGPDGKMTDKAKAERARVIAQNKKRRADISDQLKAAATRLKPLKAVDANALAVVVNSAIASIAGYGFEGVAEAAKTLGITVPKGLSFSSQDPSAAHLEKLSKIPAADVIRLAAFAIATRRAGEAHRSALSCPAAVTFLVKA